ncbi:hypothetical protein DYB38_013343 [Aphanomyces astaci]|uniref:receptor protein-tyrosine kinase n=2 Tax=Aphanomyces astaci TaxID=112090 RepID=A0A397E296_APHAT|nr:hypothetical protein DYB38_013343 [Aphanomyces astaci]
MAKSIRSKIKKYWRRELRATIGKADLEKKEAKVQAELKKAIDSQQGSSFAGLKAAFGSVKPVQVSPEVDESMTEGAVEAALLNNEIKLTNRKDNAELAKKKKGAGKPAKKKFVHFHTLRKKGVVYMRLFALDGLLLKQDALYYTGTAQVGLSNLPKTATIEAVVNNQAAIDLGVGGGGGFARASFSTSRGAVFQVSVGGGGGGGGSGAGGFGGGGRGGRGDFVGGGGGGATMVYKEKPVGTWSLLVVAPGGGGGGASAVCCSAGGAAGGLNGTAGTAPTAAQMGLPLPVASRDEFHSKFEFGDFRDFMGASAYDNVRF